jgi:hypothetical protein
VGHGSQALLDKLRAGQQGVRMGLAVRAGCQVLLGGLPLRGGKLVV